MNFGKKEQNAGMRSWKHVSYAILQFFPKIGAGGAIGIGIEFFKKTEEC
jgi:hypothetical protein